MFRTAECTFTTAECTFTTAEYTFRSGERKSLLVSYTIKNSYRDEFWIVVVII